MIGQSGQWITFIRISRAPKLTSGNMKQIGIIGTGILAGLLTAALFGCDAFEAPRQEFASAPNTSETEGTVPGGLSKAAYRATVNDFDGNTYVLTYNYAESGYENGMTVFTYNLEIGNLSGFHFAIGIPLNVIDAFDGSSPEGNLNGNANGTLEFGPEDFSSNSATIRLNFHGEIPLGITNASFKFENSGNTPEQVPILGPRQDYAAYWIKGRVFLDDPKGDLSEPGIAGVEVSLYEGYLDEGGGTLYRPNVGEPTQFTAADGSYAFHVLGPPFFTDYRVAIENSGTGLNAMLLDEAGYWATTSTLVRDVAVSPETCPSEECSVEPFGFTLDINEAIYAFENDLSVTDMLPWRFWNVQVTGTGSRKYKPVVPLDTLEFYLAVINEFNPDLTGQVYDGDITLSTAADILAQLNKNDPQEELRTLTLAALLNFAAGRGVCATFDNGADPPADDFIQFPVCAESDPTSTRLIIEQALVEWIRIQAATLSKESGGDMSRVLNAMM